MKSGWFWGTARWQEYLRAYNADRLHVEEYKTSPLSGDDDLFWDTKTRNTFTFTTHTSQVLDLSLPQQELWRGIRKSYRPLINKAIRECEFTTGSLARYHQLHTRANGRETRNQRTWDYMREWMAHGNGGLVMAMRGDEAIAGAYFIIYQGDAYYASGASIVDNVQHAVIWTAMQRLKDAGVKMLELGQIDGETKKERDIGMFKRGFGGKAVPFTIARRRLS